MIHFTSVHDFCSYVQNYVPFSRNKERTALTIKNNTIIDADGVIVGIYKPSKRYEAFDWFTDKYLQAKKDIPQYDERVFDGMRVNRPNK